MRGFLIRENRILLLMREYILGGAETQFRYLIEYAEQHGWKLDILIEHDLRNADLSVKEASAGVKNVRFFELNGSKGRGKILDILSYIIKNLLLVKYNACLIYHPRDLVLAPFLRVLGIRCVYSERVDAAGITGNPYYQKCLKYCSRILANSEFAKRELERLTGRKVKLIKNGKPVVPMLVVKQDRQIRRILVPARVAPPKNQMLPLFYLKCCPDFTGKIIFAGLLEDRAYYGKLRQFVRKNGLQNKVEFLGYVEDMREEYNKADLILLPSFAEGTPNVVLEAYGYGRPVIVSDIEAERAVVPDPNLRFRLKDPREIDLCIAYIQEMSDEAYNKLIEKNRETVITEYSIKKMAESFYKVLMD